MDKCSHDNYCILESGGLLCNADTQKNCETSKYYTRYGSDPLGVGAMMVPPRGLEAEVDG